MIDLTEQQKQALEFLNSDEKYLILSGSAGTGKTTVIAEFCKSQFNVLLTAPTHKAVKVLSTKVNKPCKTLHSYLRLERKLVGSRYEYVQDPFKELDKINLLIVDEASMIDDFLLNCILEVGVKTIFVGDNKQLNPVGYDESPVFFKGFNNYELTEIIRHQNDIIDLSRNLNWLYEKLNGVNFSWLDPSDIDLSYLVEANGSDKAKFITWRNSIVTAVNTLVRQMIYGDKPNQIEFGEVLLFNSPFKDLYRNNDELKVESLTNSHVYFNDADIIFPYIDTLLVNGKVHVVDNFNFKKHNSNINDLKERAINKTIGWDKYYKYIESFADVQYNHAITVHKSQGSTYDYAFVNVSDIMLNKNNKERDRMLYTAITRAKCNNFLM